MRVLHTILAVAQCWTLVGCSCLLSEHQGASSLSSFPGNGTAAMVHLFPPCPHTHRYSTLVTLSIRSGFIGWQKGAAVVIDPLPVGGQLGMCVGCFTRHALQSPTSAVIFSCSAAKNPHASRHGSRKHRAWKALKNPSKFCNSVSRATVRLSALPAEEEEQTICDYR